jgi:hypothetical protein
VSPQHNVQFDSNFDTVKLLVSASLWQEKAGFLSKRENKTPAPTPTGDPVRKRCKQVQFGDIPPSKKGKSASVGDKRDKEDGTCAKTNGTNENHGRKDEERGDSPLGSEHAPSQTLNDSPGLSPNVIEDELQLPEVQEPARPLGNANATNNESIQPRLVQAMKVEIFKDPYDDTLMQGEIFCLEMMHPNWDAYDEPGGPLAMKASADPDTMYHHEAMREPDRDEFKKSCKRRSMIKWRMVILK